MFEINCNQTNNRNSIKQQKTISTTAELDYSFLLLASERNAVFSSFSNNSTFFECNFREQEHLKRENGNENEKYLLLVNRQ